MAFKSMPEQESPAKVLSEKELLLKGQAPGKGPLVRQLSAGFEFPADFWKEKYLQEYTCAGGNKIKFITGKPGSGKGHFLQLCPEWQRSCITKPLIFLLKKYSFTTLRKSMGRFCVSAILWTV